MHIDTELASEKQLERVTGDLGNDMGDTARDCFAQQTLKITSGVLEFVEGTFNAFSQCIEPSVKLDRILNNLVDSFGCPDMVALSIKVSSLPK